MLAVTGGKASKSQWLWLPASKSLGWMTKWCICKDAATSYFLVAKVERGQLLQPIRKSRSEQVASLNGLATSLCWSSADYHLGVQ